MWRGVGGLPVLPRVFCFLGVSLSLVFASPSRLLCPPLFLVSQGRRVLDLGGKAHPGSARGAPAMAAAEVNADADFDQMIPVKKIRGSILHNFSMSVREALKVDQCILCNSCWLCRGCEVTRLLPYGWHKDYCAARTQLCTSVLSRISGLCNDCIRMVTDIRTVQHAGLTADGLLGVRLVIYIGMLASHENLNDDQLYLIPNVLSASLDRYTGGSLDPTLWLQSPRSMPLHQLAAQHRVQRTLSGDTVVEFILCMKRLLSCHGDRQHSCILCKKLLPTRWMIILCEGCEHILIGGGGRDTLSPSGVQILCLLHRMVEDIHRSRLSGSTRTPSVMVDAISEGIVLAVIAGTDTGSNWWLREPMVIMESPKPPQLPPIGGLIVALLVLQLAPPLRL